MCAWPLLNNWIFLYGHWRHLCFSIYCCYPWFKTWITDSKQANDDNSIQKSGAITAIQYPEHKVLPNLTQGQTQIWTQAGTQTLGCWFYLCSCCTSPTIIFKHWLWKFCLFLFLLLSVSNIVCRWTLVLREGWAEVWIRARLVARW